MKTSVVLVHIALGLLLIFYCGWNDPLHIYYASQKPDSYYANFDPASDAPGWIPEFKRDLPRRIAMDILGVALGATQIVGALAFRKDKRWATFTLPLGPIILLLGLGYTVSLGGYGGYAVIYMIPLLLFLVVELAYLALRKPVQVGLPPLQ